MRASSTLAVCGALAALFAVAPVVRAAPDVEEIMKKNFMVGKVADARAEIVMTLTNASGTRRERSVVSLSKLLPNGVDQKRVVRFLAPADVKGTATLLVEHSDGDDDIWIYLPALRKVRRLVASNKKDSFVGTDFSYGDIIGHKVDDWTHRLVGSETLDGVETWVVESEPKTDAVRQQSGYGKRKTWIRADNFVAVKGEFWDTTGAPFKTLVARDVRRIDPAADKWQAFTVEMRNTQTGHGTEISWRSLDVGVGLGDEQFTERYLEKET
jgi:uncharacterized protein